MCNGSPIDKSYALILGTLNVSWVNDRWPLPPSSETLTCWISFVQPVIVLGVFKVSWMTVLCLPSLLELASFASKLDQAFYSLGKSTNSNVSKASLKSLTYSRYATIWGSLAWYSPITSQVISSESLFTNKLRAPISLASNIPATKASYSAWLLLALKANRRACSINSPFGPSKMTPTPLPCWLEDPSTERIH